MKIFKIGRIIYMGVMVLLSVFLSLSCFAWPAMQYIASFAQGRTGFNLCIFAWLLSIIVAGVIFFSATTINYCILTYIQVRIELGNKAALKAATDTFLRTIKKI